MAKIGLNSFRYSVLTEANDGTPSYAGAMTPAKAISCNVSITNNEAKLYADDVLAESDTSFGSGTVTIGIDDEDQGTMGVLLGNAVDAGGTLVRSATDVAPYVGFGRIIVKMINNVRKYKVEVLYKVKFSEPSQDDNTQGESVEFSTSEMEGTIATLANGKWSESKVFDTKADALAYLEGLLGGTAGTTYTVTLNYGTGSGTVLTVTGNANQVVSLPASDTITPPSGKHFIGYDTTSSATKADIGFEYLVTGNVTLYAIYANN